MTVTLTVEKREKVGKSHALRRSGKIPAVFYGPKEESTPVTLSASEFQKVWRVSGESSVIELTGVGETKEVLINDIDRDPVSGVIRHVDFYVPEKGKKVEVSVPLEFIGEAPAVKELGGVLTKVLHELTIEVLPKNLPHAIEVDIRTLKDFEVQIHVRDLKLPEGVTALADADEVVALVAEVKEEVEAPVEAPDLSSIEVEKKGKEVAEGEDEAAAA